MGLNTIAAAVSSLVAVGLVLAAATLLRDHTSIDDNGDVVPADVQALADRAHVGVNVYALARVSASEAGGCSRAAKTAVCWVVRNEATRRKVSTLDVVLGSASGFGKQGTGGRGFVASSRDPGAVDYDVADQVDSGAVSDPTGGALHFDSPGAYKDQLDADGAIVRTADERIEAFASARQAEGFDLMLVDGVPAKTFRFWRRA
jgi:hypothetical protein